MSIKFSTTDQDFDVDAFPNSGIDQEPEVPLSFTDEEKVEAIEHHFKGIMEVLGLDLEDTSLQRTPRRVAEMYVKEIFAGLNPKNFPKISIVKETLNQEQNPSLVFVRVNFTSFCEHHFVPFTGIAYIAYRPSDKLIGLSKIPRIVKFFAKRPQLQERLTAQIAESLSHILETEDVAISIHATHYCVIARGVEDQESKMITNILKGEFKNDSTLRREFFEAVNRTN